MVVSFVGREITLIIDFLYYYQCSPMSSIIKVDPSPIPVQTVLSIQISLVDYQLFAKKLTSVVRMFNDSNNIINTAYVDIPEDVIESWGVDDTIIEDYILQELGMTRKTDSE